MKNIVRTAKTAMLAMAAALLTTVAAANANDAAVCRDALGKEQWSLALPVCTAAAERGDAGAQAMLGVLYMDGRGVAQDYKQAVRWYRLAANQGQAYAQFSLGVMYDIGRGIAQDYAQAIRWYRLAAEQGNAEAQYNLGLKYGLGQGVAQDYVRAHMWYNLAAVSGDTDSVKNRDIVASRMTREQIAEAQKMARDCAAKNYKGC